MNTQPGLMLQECGGTSGPVVVSGDIVFHALFTISRGHCDEGYFLVYVLATHSASGCMSVFGSSNAAVTQHSSAQIQ